MPFFSNSIMNFFCYNFVCLFDVNFVRWQFAINQAPNFSVVVFPPNHLYTNNIIILWHYSEQIKFEIFFLSIYVRFVWNQCGVMWVEKIRNQEERRCLYSKNYQWMNLTLSSVPIEYYWKFWYLMRFLSEISFKMHTHNPHKTIQSIHSNQLLKEGNNKTTKCAWGTFFMPFNHTNQFASDNPINIHQYTHNLINGERKRARASKRNPKHIEIIWSVWSVDCVVVSFFI